MDAIFPFSLTAFWLALMILFGVAEAVTVGLTSIWFAVGALAALLVSMVYSGFWGQAIVFTLVSFATLLLVRPLCARYFRPRDHTPTNSDRVIGATGVVTEEIDNLAGTGVVKVGGQHWTARSDSGAVIPTGVTVTAVRIEGVRLFVCPAK